MSKKIEKTNAVRLLDGKSINYSVFTYDNSLFNAVEVANYLGQDPAMLFKTLVTVGRSGEHYVFMTPSEKELDLKKAAKAAGEKSLEMIHQRDLLPLTGYVHGGCSPLGMKKQFKTFIDSSAENFDTVYFSGGRVGLQIAMPLNELQKAVPVQPVDIIKDIS
jgi:Cys-tRNA(Pro)/Cys-tRNA(Cys) deacylase